MKNLFYYFTLFCVVFALIQCRKTELPKPQNITLTVPDEVRVSSMGSTKDIVIMSTKAAWVAAKQTDVEWIEVKIKDSNTLQVTYTTNTSAKLRETAINVIAGDPTDGGKEAIIIFKQTNTEREDVIIGNPADPEDRGSAVKATKSTGKKSIPIEAPEGWDVGTAVDEDTQEAPTWLTAVKNGNAVDITITAENTGTEARTATIPITIPGGKTAARSTQGTSGVTITVTQTNTESATISVDPTSLRVSAARGSETITVTAPGGWTVTDNVAETGGDASTNWLEATKNSTGTGVDVVILANTGATLRSGVITINAGEESVDVSVSQAPGVNTVNFARGTYSGDEGGSVTITVSVAAAPGGSNSFIIPIEAVTSGSNPAPGTADIHDYTLPTSITIASGDTEGTFTVDLHANIDNAILNDPANETLVLQLGTLPSGLSAGTTTHTIITITDVPTVNFESDAYSGNEDSPASVNVELSEAPGTGNTITIPLSVVTTGPRASTADLADYNVPRTVDIRGTSRSGTFDVDFSSSAELGETVVITFGDLSSTMLNSQTPIGIDPDTVVVTITVPPLTLKDTTFYVYKAFTTIGTLEAATGGTGTKRYAKLSTGAGIGPDHATFNFDVNTRAFTPAATPLAVQSAAYRITIRVTDGAGSTDDATVRVYVYEPLLFTAQVFNVLPNIPATQTIGPIISTNGRQSNVSYTITGGNGQPFFDLNNSTGAITKKSGQTLTDGTTYTLTIQADDGLSQLTEDITINATSGLAFSQNSYSFNVPDGTVGGTGGTNLGEPLSVVGKVGTLTYDLTLSSPSVSENPFAVDASGQISLQENSVLNRGTYAAYTLSITATDSADPTMPVTAGITINVNTSLVFENQAFHIHADSDPIGTLDAATGGHGTMSYSLLATSGDHASFDFNANTMTITKDATATLNPNNTYTITVRAMDAATVTATRDAIITIHVYEPLEIANTFSFNVFKMASAGDEVGGLAYTHGRQSKVTYSITSSSNEFEITPANQNTGIITVQTGATLTGPTYTLTVQADDGISQPTTTVTITVVSPTVSFAQSEYVVAEGNATETVNIEVRVSLAPGTGETYTIPIEIETTDTDAVLATDYRLPGGATFPQNVTISEDATTATLAIEILQNHVGTSPKTLELQLGTLSGLMSSSTRSTTAIKMYDNVPSGLIPIRTVDQLNAMRYDLNGDGKADNSANQAAYAAQFPGLDYEDANPTKYTGYQLMSHLDFSGSSYTSGSGWEPIAMSRWTSLFFTSTFDGKGHVISNLLINRPSMHKVGLFAALGSNGIIRNLGLHAPTITGQQDTGGLVGLNWGTITSCYVNEGTITGIKNVGGLVGKHQHRMSACYVNESTVRGTELVGGLVGASSALGNGPRITACYVRGGAVTLNDVEGARAGGGVIGWLFRTTVMACYNMGSTVTGKYTASLVGYPLGNAKPIAACYTGGINSNHLIAAYYPPLGFPNFIDSYYQASPARSDLSKTSYQLRSHTQAMGYTGIYANWNVDVNNDGSPDDPWDFGNSTQYPRLKADFNGDGAVDELDLSLQAFAYSRPTVTFERDAYTVTKGRVISVKILISEALAEDLLLPILKRVGNAATYTLLTHIPIPSSATEALLNITLPAHEWTAGAKILRLKFAENVDLVLGTPNIATININDAPATLPVVEFGSGSYAGTEGEDVTVAISVNPAPGLGYGYVIPIQVLTTDTENTAQPRDYSLPDPATVSIKGDNTSGNFVITIPRGDDSDDGEKIKLGFGDLSNVSLAAGTQATTLITITDPSPSDPTVEFDRNSYTVIEGDALTVNLTLSAAQGSDHNIPISVTGGTAVSETDYEAIPSSISIPAGMTSASFTFETLDAGGKNISIALGTMPIGLAQGSKAEITITIQERFTLADQVFHAYSTGTAGELIGTIMEAEHGTGTITYSSNRNGRGITVFNFDPSTRQITRKDSNPIAPGQYPINIDVEDSSSPSPMSALGIMTVHVYAPLAFTDHDLIVPPDISTTTNIGPALSTHGHRDAITYRLNGGTGQALFTLTSEGIITKNSGTTLTDGDSYTLIIDASDDLTSSPISATVTIRVSTLIPVRSLTQLHAIRYDLTGNGEVDYPAEGVSPYSAAIKAAANLYASAFPHVSGHTYLGYELMENLDFNIGADADPAWTTGTGWKPIGNQYSPFRATFEGNGHTISNLFAAPSIHSRSRYTGLFGSLSASAAVHNLGMVSPRVRFGSVTGALASENKGTITSCYTSQGDLRGGRYAGGLVGMNYGVISACYTRGSTIRGANFSAGGLVGWQEGSTATIEACYVINSTVINRTVALPINYERFLIGGLVGNNNGGTIQASYASGVTITRGTVAVYEGGLVGQNTGAIKYSYAGARNYAGLVGRDMGTITDSYYQASSSSGQARTLSDLQTPDAFAGTIYASWNIRITRAGATDASTDIWNLVNSSTLPRLNADFNGDNIIDAKDLGLQATSIISTPTIEFLGTTASIRKIGGEGGSTSFYVFLKIDPTPAAGTSFNLPIVDRDGTNTAGIVVSGATRALTAPTTVPTPNQADYDITHHYVQSPLMLRGSNNIPYSGPGNPSGALLIRILEDGTDGGAEEIVLDLGENLSQAVNLRPKAGGNTGFTITIYDFSISLVAVSKEESGTVTFLHGAATANVTAGGEVTLSLSLNRGRSVATSLTTGTDDTAGIVIGGTAMSGTHYNALPGSIATEETALNSGEFEAKEFSIQTLAGSAGQTITLRLGTLPSGAGIMPPDTRASVTISIE